MSVRFPVKVNALSAVPSPLRNVSPVVDASVISPFVAESVTRIEFDPASTSDTEILFPFAVESTSVASSFKL